MCAKLHAMYTSGKTQQQSLGVLLLKEATLENRGIQKMEIQFFSVENNGM